MAFNVSALETYVAGASRELATKAVANATTAKLLIDSGNFSAGVKSSEDIFKMDSDVNLQDGSTCDRSPLGSTTLTSKRITVHPMKDLQNFCNKSLRSKWFAQMIAKGQNPETETLEPAFAQSIMDLRAAKISAIVEEQLWKGDTTLTGNLSFYDGILKLIASNTAITPTGTGIIAKLQSAHSQMDIVVRNQEDYRLWIGEDKHEEYLIALDNANKFKDGSEMTLTGTRAKFAVTAGLNGTGKIVMGRLSNLHFGFDGNSDADSAQLRYSVETTNWYADFFFSSGIQVIFNEQMGHATV